mmetsp:Transcript_9619/g.21465  ORF Transcript_9619/g.21465 Transcript_9619/m.21465 type:complete len:262 (-) Transcript_9619:675-1460(-)
MHICTCCAATLQRHGHNACAAAPESEPISQYEFDVYVHICARCLPEPSKAPMPPTGTSEAAGIPPHRAGSRHAYVTYHTHNDSRVQTHSTYRSISSLQLQGVIHLCLLGGRLSFALGFAEVAGDATEDVVPSCDGAAAVWLDQSLLVRLHEDSDGVPALGSCTLLHVGEPHSVQVGEQTTTGPQAQHVTNVDSNAAFLRRHFQPSRCRCPLARSFGIWCTLQPRPSWLLEEECNAIPVCVRPCSPAGLGRRLIHKPLEGLL